MQVLVVEDERRMAELLRQGLEEEGHSVVLAGNGRDGLAMAESHPFDAIVLDVMLPGLDGFSVAKKLRAARNQTPILMLTARDATQRYGRGFEFGRGRLSGEAVLFRGSAGAPAGGVAAWRHRGAAGIAGRRFVAQSIGARGNARQPKIALHAPNTGCLSC